MLTAGYAGINRRGEGLASHTVPESCVVSREAEHEALTGVYAGGVLSREIHLSQGANAVRVAVRRHRGGEIASIPWTLRGRRPPHV